MGDTSLSRAVVPAAADGIAPVQTLVSFVLTSDVSRCSKLRVQKLNLFDHIVGNGEQRRR